jgi:hypothetical protein
MVNGNEKLANQLANTNDDNALFSLANSEAENGGDQIQSDAHNFSISIVNEA